MTTPLRCDCGDSECAVCGYRQGTRTLAEAVAVVARTCGCGDVQCRGGCVEAADGHWVPDIVRRTRRIYRSAP
jgi:hypothetical protein